LQYEALSSKSQYHPRKEEILEMENPENQIKKLNWKHPQ
jgi:hypothetical protein